MDFGASDAPLTEEEMQALASMPVHIPETIDSVVAAYNLPGIDKGLKLTGPVLADIFAGKITRWDDQRIRELNPEISIPAADIITVQSYCDFDFQRLKQYLRLLESRQKLLALKI